MSTRKLDSETLAAACLAACLAAGMWVLVVAFAHSADSPIHWATVAVLAVIAGVGTLSVVFLVRDHWHTQRRHR